MRRQVLIALGLIGLCVVSARGHDRRQEIVLAQKRQALDAIKGKPLLEQKRLEEIFEICRDGDDLVLRALIPPLRYYEDRRRLVGLTWPAVVQCREESHDLNQVEFEFTYDDWSDPLVHAQLRIQSRPSELQIEKLWDTPTGQHEVLFKQMNGVVSLRLSSQESGQGGGLIQFVEPNFAVFARKHWDLLQTHVGPLLREVHQRAGAGRSRRQRGRCWPMIGRWTRGCAIRFSSLCLNWGRTIFARAARRRRRATAG